MLRQLGLLLLMIVLLIVAWALFAPVHHAPNAIQQAEKSHPAGGKPVTLQQVRKTSQVAFSTTTAYMQQEKTKLQLKMGDTLHKLDREIARLKAKTSGKTATDSADTTTRLRLLNLQGAKQNLLHMRAGLPSASQTAWRQMKANWNQLELDINAHTQPEAD